MIAGGKIVLDHLFEQDMLGDRLNQFDAHLIKPASPDEIAALLASRVRAAR